MRVQKPSKTFIETNYILHPIVNQNKANAQFLVLSSVRSNVAQPRRSHFLQDEITFCTFGLRSWRRFSLLHRANPGRLWQILSFQNWYVYILTASIVLTLLVGNSIKNVWKKRVKRQRALLDGFENWNRVKTHPKIMPTGRLRQETLRGKNHRMHLF